jgi:hypothetical protein
MFIEQGPNDEPVKVVMTEAQILKLYWVYWSTRMFEIGKGPMATEQTCIDDWVVINWAQRLV